MARADETQTNERKKEKTITWMKHGTTVQTNICTTNTTKTCFMNWLQLITGNYLELFWHAKAKTFTKYVDDCLMHISTHRHDSTWNFRPLSANVENINRGLRHCLLNAIEIISVHQNVCALLILKVSLNSNPRLSQIQISSKYWKLSERRLNFKYI